MTLRPKKQVKKSFGYESEYYSNPYVNIQRTTLQATIVLYCLTCKCLRARIEFALDTASNGLSAVQKPVYSGPAVNISGARSTTSEIRAQGPKCQSGATVPPTDVSKNA